ncbi:MAG: cytochrome c-type biogenesis protein [Ktedonobacteraceae bacterium]
MRQRRSLLILLAIVALVGAAWIYLLLAVPPQRTLDQRAYNVALQLKCPVCQGETVADSSASVAEQMRLVIRQQLQNGQSEQQVLQYFAARYGDQILLAPPTQGVYLLAWLIPIAMLLVGLGLLSFVARDWRALSHHASSQTADQAHEKRVDDPELAHYLAQLEQELADDDPLFSSPSLEIQ